MNAEHVAETKRTGEFAVRTACSCGSWLEAEVQPGAVMRFNRLCPATDVAYERWRKARKEQKSSFSYTPLSWRP